MSALNLAAIAWTLLALAVFPTQFFVTAPYGRHAHTKWGPSIGNQLGWCLMELVSLIVFAGLFLAGPNPKTAPMWIFFTLWSAHYINRSLIFPWRTHTQGKSMPLAIVGSAALFNIVNGGLNGLYLGWFGPLYPTAWLSRSPLHHRPRHLRRRRRDQPLVRQQTHRPPRRRPARLHHPARRPVRMGLLPQPHGRDHPMVAALPSCAGTCRR